MLYGRLRKAAHSFVHPFFLSFPFPLDVSSWVCWRIKPSFVINTMVYHRVDLWNGRKEDEEENERERKRNGRQRSTRKSCLFHTFIRYIYENKLLFVRWFSRLVDRCVSSKCVPFLLTLYVFSPFFPNWSWHNAGTRTGHRYKDENTEKKEISNKMSKTTMRKAEEKNETHCRSQNNLICF